MGVITDFGVYHKYAILNLRNFIFCNYDCNPLYIQNINNDMNICDSESFDYKYKHQQRHEAFKKQLS